MAGRRVCSVTSGADLAPGFEFVREEIRTPRRGRSRQCLVPRFAMSVPFDVVIVGAGPAGLSAALVLGRARRQVCLVDDGHPRNARARAVHGFLTRDGIPPEGLLRIAREQLAPYRSVRSLADRVVSAQCKGTGFALRTRSGTSLECRKVVLASGVADELPDLPGIGDLYGRSAFHCPFCDGWEVRDRALAVVDRDGARGAALSLELLAWSRNVVLCTDGAAAPAGAAAARLARHGVAVRTARIARLEGHDGQLAALVLADGTALARDALFFHSAGRQQSELQGQLGCAQIDPHGRDTLRYGRTDVAGVYIVGDASRDVHQVSIAAAEGAEAAISIVTELVAEDFP